jgi:Resolvase, N terminal domain
MPSVHPDHFADQGISVAWTVDGATGQREKLLAVLKDAYHYVEQNWHDEPVRLDCGSEPVSANAASRLFFGILASVAEFEKARIAKRVKEGRTGKRARGGHTGGSAPYGYRVEGQGRLAVLVPEQTEQDMIATMRKLSGYMSLRKLAEKLDRDGIRTRRGTAFSPMHLHRILSRG